MERRISKSQGWCGSQMGGIFGLVVAGLICLAPWSVQAERTPKEIRSAAQAAFSVGAFEDAASEYQLLVSYYKDSTQEVIIMMMEAVYYNLGLCHIFLAEFPQARDTYEEYLKRYRRTGRAHKVAIMYGDAWRLEGKRNEALKAYNEALKTYQYDADLLADLHSSMARCYMADDDWEHALPLLLLVYRNAPDFSRRNWAATYLAVAFLKERKLDAVYRMVPYLLRPNSVAARSVAFNMTALETGDELFAEERFRDAMWIYRLVYPHDLLTLNCENTLEQLEKKAIRMQRRVNDPRKLIRIHEQISEAKAEVDALEQIENYDQELFFRVARGYMESRRYREARELFHYLYREGLEEFSEECLYYAFSCSTHVRPWDKAFEIGAEYMEAFPAGDYYDTVTLTLGQLRANLKQWPETIDVLTTALDVHPEHENEVECRFLIGYACFMEELFQECDDQLTTLNEKYPGNDREPDATYWMGMARLFDKRYEEAIPAFTRVIEDFMNSVYVEDATFRRATCLYGLSRWEEALEAFKGFLERYPDSVLVGEAYVNLGDIYGALGRLLEAVDSYQKVSQYEVNIELYNHAAFRCGEMLDGMKNYKALIEHFTLYLSREREGMNAPLAIYWVGNAYWNLEEHERALNYYLQAIERYGGDRTALGIDLILEEWVGKAHAAEPKLAQRAWQDMRDLRNKALKNKQVALVLRLDRVLLFNPLATDQDKRNREATLLNPRYLPYASAGVLDWIRDEAARRSLNDLAEKAANSIIDDFPETDYALGAYMLLAKQAESRDDDETAIAYLGEVREQFAASDEACEALMELGAIYRRQDETDLSDECYSSILGAKSWRNRWPEALYGRGETAMKARKYEKAAAYFERIYLLYGNYTDWVAKAYLARANCLGRLNLIDKAAEVLREMLGQDALREFPEYREARELLTKLEGRM